MAPIITYLQKGCYIYIYIFRLTARIPRARWSRFHRSAVDAAFCYCFFQANSRFASLKLRVEGGKINLITAYVPNNGYPYVERQKSFTELGDFENRLSAHGPNPIYGDMNAPLYSRLLGEDAVLGPHIFQVDEAVITDEMNRHLLIEFCICARV